MEVNAKLRFLRMSPRKVRLVIDLVRGLPVAEAEHQLTFLNKRASRPVLKLLQSAIANGENNFKLNKENFYIKRATVDQGPSLKRWRPRAFGRAAPILKRSCHITIVLDELKTDKKKAVKSKKLTPAKEATTKAAKLKQPVVKYEEIKHEAKYKKEESDETKLPEKNKPSFSFKNIKEKFTRRLGEK